MIKNVKHTCFFLACLLIGMNSVFAQNKQNNQWRFGFGGAIDFNTVPASFVNGAALATPEGSASVADRVTGSLLFYTDGVTVWNANNQVMPNGTGLFGGVTLSSTTAAVIVPKPGSSNLYYIITVDEFTSNNGVRYSVVDMTLNGGLGDVVAGQKNIFLFQTSEERLEVIPASDGQSYWLLTHNNLNSSFYAFRINNAGIQNTPVVSTVGSAFQINQGHIKVNKQFNKVAIGISNDADIELFDFDNSTGILSNPITLNFNLQSTAFGIEFSPDGTLLYFSDGYSVLQLDLTQTTALAIQNSAYQVTTTQGGTLQVGIDEKIYVASVITIDAINCPNKLGAACGYQTNAIATGPSWGGGNGLPKWVYYPNDTAAQSSNAIVFNENCFGANTQFFIADTTRISGIVWNFGDPNTGTNNIAVGDTAFHVFSQIGNYTIQAILITECGFDTLFTDVAILFPCDPQDEQCVVFEYTGVVQQWTVPSGVDTIRVKMWGAGGGGGPYLGDVGGGGGYTKFELAVTPGESLVISVGQGGKAALGGTGGAGGWPGGGDGGSGNLSETIFGVLTMVGGGGGGGGATIIRRLTNNTLIAVAGSGGGSAYARNGGDGGGLEGQFTALNNSFNQFGFGGTQTAGGAPSQNTLSTNSVLGSAGSAFQGGIGATDLNPDNQRKGGGGGGSGYYGGGGGSAYDGTGFGVGSAGGGGSGFLLCTNCPNLSGSLLGANQFDGTPANPFDPLLSNYPGTGKGNMGSNGGNGLVQICYTSLPCSPTTASILATACTSYTAPWGASYNQTGTYSDTIVNSDGCDSIINITLSITGLPTATATSTPGTCGLSNGTASVTASGGSGTYTYAWSNGATGIFNTSLAEGSYTVTATDQNGCSALAQVNVAAIPPVNVLVTASDTLIQYGDSVNLSVKNGVDYTWTPSTGLSCSNCSTLIANPLKNTTYFVTGKDTNGCAYSRSVTIVVEIICNELFVPDIFSPNGTGNPENDKLCVYSNCIKEMTFAIYNRWGELIFLTNDVNACWDGTHKGSEASTGTYVYRLYVEQLDGQKIERTGNISLTR